MLLGQPTSALTPLYPFWRSLWTSVALLPYLFVLASLLGGNPHPPPGLSTVSIPALEHLASPGAVPLGPAVPPPWRSILAFCGCRHCSAALPVFALDIIPSRIWAQLPHILPGRNTEPSAPPWDAPRLLLRFSDLDAHCSLPSLLSACSRFLPFRLCPLFQTFLLANSAPVQAL